MHNIFKGIVVGILGFIVWFLASVVGGLLEGLGGGRDPFLYGLVIIAGLTMIGGPVVYIVVLPVAGWLKRRRAHGGVRASPSPP